ncbi:MAG: hypothetical protein AAFY88_02470 [Acidobacteriota bacterium]
MFTRQFPRPFWSRCISLIVPITLAAPAFAGGHLLELRAATADVPAATSITLERLDRSSRVVDQTADTLTARVAVEWSTEALQALGDQTGRMDRVTWGGVTFRDDGLGVDDFAGDRVFHAVLDFQLSRLRDRAEADRAARDRGAREVTHRQRAKVGSGAVEPFDVEGLLAGRVVELRPSRHAVETSPVDDLPEGGPSATGRALKVPGTNAFQESVLAIRDPAVVRDFSRTFDPCGGVGAGMGPWSFGHLMTELANHPVYPTPPEILVEQWLQTWTVPQTINGFTAPQRPAINALINDWRAASAGPVLDLSIAPFRLLTILSRVDLRESTGGATGPFLNGGEARFVFGAVVPPTWPSAGTFPGPVTGGGCKLLPFTVIFEYKIPLNSCVDVQAWANSWIHLSTLVPGTVPYQTHLENLTHTFTRRNAWPGAPLDSALGQLRTNENAFNPLWELREFHADSALGLRMTETADNADNMFQNTALFRDYVAIDFASGALTEVPSTYTGVPFRTGNPLVPIDFTKLEPLFYWDENSLVPGGFVAERHEVSLASCNGCHGGETATPFVHISPTAPMPPARAALSQFMTGFTLRDPAVDQAIADGRIVGSPISRVFDALEDREADINSVSAWLCPTPPPKPVVAPKPGDLPLVGATAATKAARPALPLEDLLRSPVSEVH